jgi:hypothetical protein
MNPKKRKHIAIIGKFFREVWQDFKNESTDSLATLLYFFILLGLFLLALSFSYPRL